MTTDAQDATTIRAALDAARRGVASVRQLAFALELATKHKLPGAIAELRSHLHAMTNGVSDRDFIVGEMLAIGVISGILTNFILRATWRRA